MFLKSKKRYMKGLISFCLLTASLFQCGKNPGIPVCGEGVCTTLATVTDMTGLDGCGLMFELADGTLLEPERRVYVKAPTVEEDPLYHFDLRAGQVVSIDWVVPAGLASTCMAGPIVFITCIHECKKPIN